MKQITRNENGARGPWTPTGALALAALITLGLAGRADAGHGTNSESAVPRLDPAPAGDPTNRLEESAVVLRAASDLAGVAMNEVQLASLADEDAATRLTLAPAASLEFAFTGAPRWIDHVVLSARSDAPATARVEVLTNDGWVPFASGEITAAELASTLTGREVYAQALRLTMEGSAPVDLVEMTAGYSPVDPDRGPILSDNLLHYDWVNSYPGDNDLNKCDNDAHGLRDHLPGSWGYGGHGNSDAHEHHYKRDDTETGCNSTHMDWADLSYFSGHGSQNRADWYYEEDLGAFIFGGNTDDQEMCPGDARGAWGNGNCEWHAMSSCKTLTSDSWDYWYGAMDGLHMILGASTTVADKNYGTTWANRMVDNGIFDSAHGVRSSWAYSLDLHNWDGTAVIIAETEANGGDHLWGQGSVTADATHNGAYHWWTYDLGLFARENHDPLSTALIQDRARFDAPMNPSLLPKLTSQGMDIEIDQSLLRAPITQAMPCYNVVPFNVSDTYVRSIANAICQNQGVLCGGTIGSSGDGSRNLIVGPYELRVNEATGNYEYVDTSEWLAWKKTKPTLPSESAALGMANQVMSQWPGTPQGGIYAGFDYPGRACTRWASAICRTAPSRPCCASSGIGRSATTRCAAAAAVGRWRSARAGGSAA
ncbi:MAG: DUF6345 domain-containing protein [Candidatus Eisenbacteria bacterium]